MDRGCTAFLRVSWNFTPNPTFAGAKSLYHLARTFKRETGLTPRQFAILEPANAADGRG